MYLLVSALHKIGEYGYLIPQCNICIPSLLLWEIFEIFFLKLNVFHLLDMCMTVTAKNW